MTQNPYVDEQGRHFGYCNSCGEEAELDQECANPDCDDAGEVVPYDDDPDPEEAG